MCILTVLTLPTVWAATWNHLLYLVGDNDLEYFAVKDTQEMLSMRYSDIRLTVFVDRASSAVRGATSASLGGGISNFVAGKILLLDNGNWNTLESTVEPDMAEPDTLRDFIKDYQPRLYSLRSILRTYLKVIWNMFLQVFHTKINFLH